jgi:hypothetical protein
VAEAATRAGRRPEDDPQYGVAAAKA